MELLLSKKIFLSFQMECVTGLHIGGNNDRVDIGGINQMIVRLVHDNTPYIPGSSIKGKMRCLLEQSRGENSEGKGVHNGGEVCKLFGGLENSRENIAQQPSRIIVRDAYMTKASQAILKKSRHTDLLYTEVKTENVIDRISGKAKHPRTIERVPAGTCFEVNLVLNVFAEKGKIHDSQKKLLKTLDEGLSLVESDYLGGGGSRGNGQVRFSDLKITEKYFGEAEKAVLNISDFSQLQSMVAK